MEAVIFVGIPGSGKSSFFQERFFHTHVRISLDLLKTRHREGRMLDVCLATEQRFVIDNTNPTQADRARYINLAKARRFTVTGYYFQSQVADCLARNALREGSQRVPDVAILATAKNLEIPNATEGFDKLFYVRLDSAGFAVEDWCDELR